MLDMRCLLDELSKKINNTISQYVISCNIVVMGKDEINKIIDVVYDDLTEMIYLNNLKVLIFKYGTKGKYSSISLPNMDKMATLSGLENNEEFKLVCLNKLNNLMYVIYFHKKERKVNKMPHEILSYNIKAFCDLISLSKNPLLFTINTKFKGIRSATSNYMIKPIELVEYDEKSKAMFIRIANSNGIDIIINNIEPDFIVNVKETEFNAVIKNKVKRDTTPTLVFEVSTKHTNINYEFVLHPQYVEKVLNKNTFTI